MINSEPCADDRFIVKRARCPGDAYPRIKVPVARKVCGSAFRADIRYGGVRARQDPSCAGRVKNRHAIMSFADYRIVFPTDAQVQRDVRPEFPFVLKVRQHEGMPEAVAAPACPEGDGT